MVAATETVKGTKNGNAQAAEDDGFKPLALSRPTFIAAECKGPVQGFILNILGPFPAGKESVNQTPWFAYAVKLTAPCECRGPEGEKVTAPKGEEIMVPISAQLKNIANLAVDENNIHEVRLSPGPQPKPGKMRFWKGEHGRTMPRGADFPLVLPGGNKTAALLLPANTAADAADEGQDNPF